MTCRSCGFENMRGSKTCFRCGAILVWEMPPLEARDALPPRAGRGGLFSRARILRRRLRETGPARSLTSWRRATGEVIDGFSLTTGFWNGLKWSVIPGLWHCRVGQGKRGKWFLGVWAGALALMYATYPSVFSNLMSLALPAAHFAAVFDATGLRAGSKNRFSCFAPAFALILCLWAVYFLVYRLLGLEWIFIVRTLG